MNRKFRLAVVLVSTMLGSNTLLAACATAPDSATEEQPGTLTAALVATGSDGATYRFPPNTRLSIWSMQSEGFTDSLSLSADSSSVAAMTLPPGRYRAELDFRPGYLIRIRDHVETAVTATPLDLMPIRFEIGSGLTTSIALGFFVEGLNDLKFETGRLEVTAAVIASQADAFGSAQVRGSLHVTDVADAPEASTRLAPLAMTTGETHDLSLTLSTMHTWHLGAEHGVCADVRVDGVGDPSAAASGFTRRMDQVMGTWLNLCITDTGADDLLTLNGIKVGEAPEAQRAYLPGTYNVAVYLRGQTGLDLLNGTSFRQSLLETPTLIRDASFTHQLTNDSYERLTHFDADFAEVTLKIAP